MFILLQCSEYDCQQICSQLCEPLRCMYMENASFVNMEPILVPGDKINHTDFVGDQSKLFLTSAGDAVLEFVWGYIGTGEGP